MKRPTTFFFLYWTVAIGIIASLLWYTNAFRSASPADSVYSYAGGHLGDFYGYSYMIQRGREGHVMYKNVYTIEQIPEILIHPFFHVLGFISRPFHASLGVVFVVSRFVMWVLLFWSVYVWIQKTLRKEVTKIMAGVFFFTASSLWDIRTFLEHGDIRFPVIWNDYFDMYSKYVRIPPHHLAAFVCVIWLFIYLVNGSRKRHVYVIACALSACIGLLQPYISFFLTIIFVAYTLLYRMTMKRFPDTIMILADICITSICFVAINYFQLQYVMRLPFATTATMSIRNVSIATYAASLGPLVWLSLLAFGNKRYVHTSTMKLLTLWAWMPVVFFLLPEVGNITSTNRLLQTYQQIPFAMLAAIGVDGVLEWVPFQKFLVLCIILLSFVYGCVPYSWILYKDTHTIHTEYFNVYIPQYLLDTFTFIDDATAPDSMILGGTAVSAMIPAYTHSRVFIGHDSSTPNFTQKVANSMALYQGSMTADDVKRFLSDGHIAYILFGLDATAWEQSPYSELPFLKLIYSKGPMRLVQVNL